MQVSNSGNIVSTVLREQLPSSFYGSLIGRQPIPTGVDNKHVFSRNDIVYEGNLKKQGNQFKSWLVSVVNYYHSDFQAI